MLTFWGMRKVLWVTGSQTGKHPSWRKRGCSCSCGHISSKCCLFIKFFRHNIIIHRHDTNDVCCDSVLSVSDMFQVVNVNKIFNFLFWYFEYITTDNLSASYRKPLLSIKSSGIRKNDRHIDFHGFLNTSQCVFSLASCCGLWNIFNCTRKEISVLLISHLDTGLLQDAKHH